MTRDEKRLCQSENCRVRSDWKTQGPTSFSHEVRVPLVDFLLPPVVLILERASLLSRDGPVDVENSAVERHVGCERTARVGREDGIEREGVGRSVLDLQTRRPTKRSESASTGCDKQNIKLTGIELTPVPPTSAASRLASSIAFSASSFFQKQTNPVPRDRLVALSMVIRAYRRGP